MSEEDGSMREIADAITGAAEALSRGLESPNEADSNLETPANVVDVLAACARSGRAIADAISADAGPGTDATGGTIRSLTEAAMGVTAGLVRIADAITDLAEAVRETAPDPALSRSEKAPGGDDSES